ncbi:TIGR02285 family protein [bacterium]|nr:TIGR02285 family protein [bacterium]
MHKFNMSIGLTFFSLMTAVSCYATEQIKWYLPHVPPCYITQGKDKGTGHCDKMQKTVIDSMPEYDHKIVISNYKRMLVALENENNACSSALFKVPARESFLIYSKAAFIGLSSAIVTSARQVEHLYSYISQNQLLNLKKLLSKEKEIRIGVMKGRSFGPDIEPIIAPHRNTPVIVERSGSDSVGLIKMMYANRLDMILGIPLEATYTAQQMQLPPESIVILPLQGIKNYNILYMACSKNKQGEAVINKLNQIILRDRLKFIEFYKEWMDDNSARMYDSIVKGVFEQADVE